MIKTVYKTNRTKNILVIGSCLFACCCVYGLSYSYWTITHSFIPSNNSKFFSCLECVTDYSRVYRFIICSIWPCITMTNGCCFVAYSGMFQSHIHLPSYCILHAPSCNSCSLKRYLFLAISKFQMLFCLVCPKDHKIKATTASLILYRSSLWWPIDKLRLGGVPYETHIALWARPICPNTICFAWSLSKSIDEM